MPLPKVNYTNAFSSFITSSHSNESGFSPRALKTGFNLFGNGPLKKNFSSFSIAPSSIEIKHVASSDSLNYLQWKELKVEQVKKRQKIFFFADRIIKFYENGYIGYYKQKSGDLKALLAPTDIKSVSLESGSSKDKMKLVTKSKTYLFKFNSQEIAREWYDALSECIKRLA